MTLLATVLMLILLALGLPVLILIVLFRLAMGAPRHPRIPRTRNRP